MTDPVARLAALLAGDPSTLFITGAGISADSGLPTYRGVGGLYEGAPTAEGVPIEVALSGPTFRRDPALTWRCIRQIEEACRGAEPNAAHRAIAALQRRLSRAVVLTQNVDGLHARAGSTDLIAIHGTLHDLRCTRCAWAETVADYAHLPPLPSCPRCGAVVRPEVVLFEEMLPPAAVARLERELERGFDLVLSIGTTSAFPYIAAPVALARQRGGVAFEINPGTTEVSHLVHHRIRLGAADAFTRLAPERAGS
jgi:NAD-dependent deacetylase